MGERRTNAAGQEVELDAETGQYVPVDEQKDSAGVVTSEDVTKDE